MGIYLKTIQFELTRKCNDCCIHCCRGESQNVDLSEQVIDSFFDNNKIEYIDRLLLSGGEPTLAPSSFKYLVDKIINKNIKINLFEFSINGLIYSDEFVESLIKLNNYCLSLKDKKYKFGGVFWISNDQFHKEPPLDVLLKYQNLPFFVPYKNQKNEMRKEDILPVGRALKNNLSSYDFNIDEVINRGLKSELVVNDNKKYILIPFLYISSNGNIQNDYGSMLSYDLIDKYSFGNILSEKLENIILLKEHLCNKSK
ncbi:MAG: radical SAM protein [Bacilli bacterium]|nr:radical SAM protein [Bacilli bacterium]